MKKLLVAIVFAAGVLGMGASCEDTANPSRTKHPTVRLISGSVLGSSNYGLWHAGSEDKSCRWTVTKKGKKLSSGGLHDSVISATSTRGATLNATHCGVFTK